jgi:hypothetical protein
MPETIHENTIHRSGPGANWRDDLEASRDLTDLEKQNYGFILAGFETWRLRQGSRAGAEYIRALLGHNDVKRMNE